MAAASGGFFPEKKTPSSEKKPGVVLAAASGVFSRNKSLLEHMLYGDNIFYENNIFWKYLFLGNKSIKQFSEANRK